MLSGSQCSEGSKEARLPGKTCVAASELTEGKDHHWLEESEPESLQPVVRNEEREITGELT